MLKTLQSFHPMLLLLIATVLEASGDAVIRIGIYNHAGSLRIALFVLAAVLLFGYGCLLNLAPLEFGRVVGLYVATLFVIFQLINLIAFRAWPTLPITIGGGLIIAGGAITAFWTPV
jgi:hypothetical protein